jgi:hypothetical protein
MMAGCRHQDSNLGRTNHTALNRARLTTLAWRRNSKIANDSANHFGTQRRESDLNTRVLADAAVPAQSLDQAREIPPTVRRRVELRSLAALGFKPSTVAYPHVSPSPLELAPTSPLVLLTGTPEDVHRSSSDPHFRGECVHQHPVTAGMDDGYLVPWKYAPSPVTQIFTLPIVSIDVVSPSGT